MDGILTNPGWFRRMTPEEKEQINQHLWREGRLKLEPWLAKRVAQEKIHLFPQSQETACRESANDELDISLNGSTLVVDQIILATGYKVNVAQIPLLADGNILTRLKTQNGFPIEDWSFEWAK